MARLMDLFVYMPLCRHDPQPLRKEYYGQPGIFRAKPYGMEYRTPSNNWVASTHMTSVIAVNTFQLVSCLEEDPDGMFDFFERTNWPGIAAAINSRGTRVIAQAFRTATMTLPFIGNFHRAEA
jgi:hypothetical protein